MKARPSKAVESSISRTISQSEYRRCCSVSAPKGHFFQAHQKGAKSGLIWEVDPQVCPKCTSEMRIISFIYKKTVIKEILTHLNLYEERKNKRAPPVVKPEYTELVERASYDDGWSGYEEPVFDFKKRYQVISTVYCDLILSKV